MANCLVSSNVSLWMCDVHAVHLMEAAQKEIVANLSAKFTVNGHLMAASNAANSYVHLLADDGPFMICAIVDAIWAAHMASQHLSKDKFLKARVQS